MRAREFSVLALLEHLLLLFLKLALSFLLLLHDPVNLLLQILTGAATRIASKWRGCWEKTSRNEAIDMPCEEPAPRSIASLYAEAALGPAWRLFWLKAVVACGMLAGFLLSPNLWLAERDYPLCPISDLLPNVPPPLDRVWFGTLVVLLVVIAVTPYSRGLIGVFVGLAGLLSLWDQSRWQPWFYQYLFMLAAFIFARGEQPLTIARFIVAATYVWSGLQKCNASFLTEVYPWLLEPFLSEPARAFVLPGGLVIPFLEAGMGIGLLVPKLRMTALVVVLAMHAAILYCLGPLGHDWNRVVWPWNLAMMAAAVILFWRTPEISLRAIVWPSTRYSWLVLLLFGVMPFFSFLGLWDSYLSAALYSGNEIHADVIISPKVRDRLAKGIQRHCIARSGTFVVDLDSWSMDELNVPSYPARRVFRGVARSFFALAAEPADVVLLIHEAPHWRTGIREQTREDCGALHGALLGASFRLESASTNLSSNQIEGRLTHGRFREDQARNLRRRRRRGERDCPGPWGVVGSGPDDPEI
jgi:hypothetical protein